MANNNKHTGPNVPALRFPEFSGEWETFQLSDLAAYSKERVKMEILSSDNYVSTENMQQDFAGIKDAISLPSSGTAVEFQVGDILISNIRPYLKKIWLSDRNGGCSTDVLALRAKNEKVDSSFLYCCLANDDFVSYVMSGAKGVKMPRGDKQHILSYNLGVPSVQEQRRIAELVSLLEKRISAQSKIIEEQETLLKSLRESLLKQCSKSSVSCKIGDILTIRNGKDYQHLENGDIPVYGTGGLMCHVNNFLHDGESVCIGRKGTINKPLYLNGKFWPVDTLFYTHSFKGVLPRYCYHLFCTIDWLTYNEASGVPSLSKSTIEKISVVIPPIKIQESTVQALDSVEQKIDIDRNVLLGYQQQKEYLLSRQ